MNYIKTSPAEREARAKRMAGLARQAMLDALKMKLRESTFVFFTERTPHAYMVGVFLLGTGNVSQVFEGERLMGRLVVKFGAYFDQDRLVILTEGTDPYETTWGYASAAYLCVKERIGAFRP